jgi:hypothetical protein
MFWVVDSVKLAIGEGSAVVRFEAMGKGDIPSSLKEDFIIPLPIAISFLRTRDPNEAKRLERRRVIKGLGIGMDVES